MPHGTHQGAVAAHPAVGLSADGDPVEPMSVGVPVLGRLKALRPAAPARASLRVHAALTRPARRRRRLIMGSTATCDGDNYGEPITNR
jgi:hypothetical protein